MEEKIIQYNGMSLSPSDQNVNDGDASIAYNVVAENGELLPFIMPDKEFVLNTKEERIQCVHATSSYRHLISLKDGVLYWYDMDSTWERRPSLALEGLTDTTISKVQTLGNTLIAFTDTGMHYFLFKNGAYKYLGQKPPETEIVFGLDGEYKCYNENEDSSQGDSQDEFSISSSESNIDFNNHALLIRNGSVYSSVTIPESIQSYFSDTIMAKVASFISQQKKKGRFMFPFFIRYAYRLFDGSYTMHSAPILMIPNSSGRPYVYITDLQTVSNVAIFKYIIGSPCAEIRIIRSGIRDALYNWKDIVKSIDIFVSEPIYGYDPSGKITEVKSSLMDKSTAALSDSRMSNFKNFDSSLDGYYRAFTDSEAMVYGTKAYVAGSYLKALFALPDRKGDNNSLNDIIENTSLFYKIKSYEIEDKDKMELKDNTLIELGETDLSTLAVKERLELDDYFSHDTLVPSTSFLYNRRLSIGNVVRHAFKGFPFVNQKGYTQGTILVNASSGSSVSSKITCEAYIYIRNDEGDDIVVKDDPLFIEFIGDRPLYLFYPNPKAYKIIVRSSTEKNPSSERYYSYSLKEHPLLNGAYWFDSFRSPMDSETDIPQVTESDAILEPNKMYTSEVGNPFVFPLTGVNDIGVGSITAIAANTRPVSTGQFGEYPLFAFCSDGVYSLSMSSTGTIATIKPYSREILCNGNVLPIDNAIIAITEKGVMSFGDGIENLSASMYGRTLDNNSIRHLVEIANNEGFNDVTNMVSFNTFMRDCVPAYDYPNQRILFSNAQYGYTYVLSLRSGAWTCIEDNFLASVSDYPNAYIQTEKNELINIAQPMDYDTDRSAKYLYLSRPIKLGSLQYKQISEVIVRGTFNYNLLKCVLYASTDGKVYFPIGSCIGNRIIRLCGTPFRFFRLLQIGELGMADSMDGMYYYIAQRWDNKPR